MLRQIKTPFIMWWLLTSILFAPMFVEFKFDCGCNETKNLTQEQKDDAAIHKTVEFNKAIAAGQIDLSGGWWLALYIAYIVSYVVVLIISTIDTASDIYPLIWNLKYLETKEGSYFYIINKKIKLVEVYKQNILTYERVDYLSIRDNNYKNATTTTDITTFLNDVASKIDIENLSYLTEEMSTWKRFK